jgi:hypothetical protein
MEYLQAPSEEYNAFEKMFKRRAMLFDKCTTYHSSQTGTQDLNIKLQIVIQGCRAYQPYNLRYSTLLLRWSLSLRRIREFRCVFPGQKVQKRKPWFGMERRRGDGSGNVGEAAHGPLRFGLLDDRELVSILEGIQDILLPFLHDRLHLGMLSDDLLDFVQEKVFLYMA